MITVRDVPAARPAARRLRDRHRRIRDTTVRLCAPLGAEDMMVQAVEETSPTKWHLAHTTWFFETFVLEPHEPGFRPYHEAFRVLFNSYYRQVGDRQPRDRRGLLTRPGLGEVMAYRDVTDDRIAALLESAPPATLAQVLPLIELGLQHEQQHQELILMDLKRLLSCNPLEPAYRSRDEGVPSPRRSDGDLVDAWIDIDGGIVPIGHDPDAPNAGFAYDNEGPRHDRLLEPFQLAAVPVTNGAFAEFIEAGGYRDARWWLDEGWSTVVAEGWTMPLYWQREGPGRYSTFTLHGRQPLDRDAPALHLSFHEAEAYARWRGARLPTEAEWEAAAAPDWTASVAAGRFLDRALDEGSLDGPSAMSAGDDADADAGPPLRRMAGEAWQWTRSAHEPYPRYAPPPGAVGEYNGKFMCGSFVLRGGSWATPRDHVRVSYRNFFHPGARWAFAGIRLARDVARGTTAPVPAAIATTTGERHDDSHAAPAAGREAGDGDGDGDRIRPTIIAPPPRSLADDLLEGFTRPLHQKRIPPHHLYDAAGGRLFDRITQLEEYSLPRRERAIMDAAMPALAARLGAGISLIEPGAGDGSKAEHLLGGLADPRLFVPIEVNHDALERCTRRIAARFPSIGIQPIRGDVREGLRALRRVPSRRRLVFLPGSTIGNWSAVERRASMQDFARVAGPGGRVLLGADLLRDPAALKAAYDDAEGISARFARNLIERLNRECGAELDSRQFGYEATWDDAGHRVEMALVSRTRQTFTVCDTPIVFEAGERIVTEHSVKFSVEGLVAEAATAGLESADAWTDDDQSFCVLLLHPTSMDPSTPDPSGASR